MTERERLKELISNCCFEKPNMVLMTETETLTFADHLLASGVIVPPCKVGDTVYQIDTKRIYESKIKSVIYDTDGISFDERAIGKNVFLTRAEAEAALKARDK